MIDKLAHLDARTQKEFYKELTQGFLEYFGLDYYSSEKELQDSFHDFKSYDRRSYRDALESILDEIAPEGIKLTWRDLKRLNYRRWRLCKVCGAPFIAYGSQNKTRICYLQDYNRYKVGVEGKSGYYFKGVLDGLSQCYMKNKTIMEKKRIKEKKEQMTS